MAGTNVESARQKSAGDEMLSAEFLPKQNRRELNSAATIRWLSSSTERKENCANWKLC
jgi:hypothetical protein